MWRGRGYYGPKRLALMLGRPVGDLPKTGAPLPPRAEDIPSGTTVVDFPTPQSVALLRERYLRRKTGKGIFFFVFLCCKRY